MKNVGKRRNEQVNGRSINDIWTKAWGVIYLIVNITTYLIAVVAMLASAYHVFVVYDPARAVGEGLLVLLMAKMNQLNP